MILKASQRGGAKQLAAHLLNGEENEHVELFDLRGFAADDLTGALHEAYAVSRATRCEQFLFSVSLNPPPSESVRIEVFEEALRKIEERVGLQGQPRAVIFHEKQGRRHAHAVWSRIDADTLTAKQLSFFKQKLTAISREMFLENGWSMPKGLMESKARDPLNLTLEEWQQAKRQGYDAKAMKAAILECWAVSDSRAGFESALEERGLYLAQGNRRACVAVSHEGHVVAIARAVNIKTKDVVARLGEPQTLRTIDETRAHIAERITPRLKLFIEQAQRAYAFNSKSLLDARRQMVVRHQAERALFDHGQTERQAREMMERKARLRTGIKGLWDLLRGERSKQLKRNALETAQAKLRDREERHLFIASQLSERRDLQQRLVTARTAHQERMRDLFKDIDRLAPARQAQDANLEPKRSRARDLDLER